MLGADLRNIALRLLKNGDTMLRNPIGPGDDILDHK